MAATHHHTHQPRQAGRAGFRLLGFCFVVALLAAACGSDGGEGTTAGADTDDATETIEGSESSDAESSDAASSEAGTSDADEADTEDTADESAATASDEETTSSSSVDTTTSTTAPETTAVEESSTTLDKSSVLTNPDETKPSTSPTTVAGNSGDPLADQVIGMTESAAIDLIRSTGRAVRVESRDGEQFMLTQDFDPERLNLTVVNGSVTGVRPG